MRWEQRRNEHIALLAAYLRSSLSDDAAASLAPSPRYELGRRAHPQHTAALYTRVVEELVDSYPYHIRQYTVFAWTQLPFRERLAIRLIDMAGLSYRLAAEGCHYSPAHLRRLRRRGFEIMEAWLWQPDGQQRLPPGAPGAPTVSGGTSDR
jgi:hypothetical protein